jgi:hypothetical protein
MSYSSATSLALCDWIMPHERLTAPLISHVPSPSILTPGSAVEGAFLPWGLVSRSLKAPLPLQLLVIRSSCESIVQVTGHH